MRDVDGVVEDCEALHVVRGQCAQYAAAADENVLATAVLTPTSPATLEACPLKPP